MNEEVKESDEQVRYANILFYGAWAGIAEIVVLMVAASGSLGTTGH